MGSAGEVEVEDASVDDVENTVFVAVGKNVKEGKSLLSWALNSFPGKRLCILHVHQPTHFLSLSLMEGKKLTSELNQEMHKLLNQYLQFVGRRAAKMWIEMSNIEKGITKIIADCGVRWLVMGAASEKYYSKNLVEMKSRKAIFVCQQAPASCHIWFVCQGCLIYTKPVSTGPNLEIPVVVSATTNGGKSLVQKIGEDGSEDARGIQISEHPVGSRKNLDGMLVTSEMRRNSLPLFSLETLGKHVPHSRSLSSPVNGIHGETSGSIYHDLEQTVIDAENSKQKAFEESLRRWRAEEDAMDAIKKAKDSESMCLEETDRRKKLEESLSTQMQELEKMKNQHNWYLNELQIVQDQQAVLKKHLTESSLLEEELEDKIIQAVRLLITFKDKRDKLQRECENATTEVNQLKALLKEDCGSQFCTFSFLDIVEATQNFDPSWKIHEGSSGITYRGNLCRVKVAIKMLPLSNSQCDQDFLYKVEVLSRVRHPHLVTLMGTCTESRSLIYEYLENGCLEDHLRSQAKTSALPWQSRIRIAVEICSALVFLHASSSCFIHGNLKTTKILLDANFVSKIGDFGTHILISKNKNPVSNPTLGQENVEEVSACSDLNHIETGKLTAESDVYSYGIILLRLLTGRPASNIVKDVKCAMQSGTLSVILDSSAGNWPLEEATQLANLALRCCEEPGLNRPDLESEVWREVCTISECYKSTPASLASKAQARVPGHFVCPIFQEIMKDPYIAADGFTYEGDAIKGWLNGGHKTSPMTNLQLDNCELIPNYALYNAIQEWQWQWQS